MSSLPTGSQGPCAICGSPVTVNQLTTYTPPKPTRSVLLDVVASTTVTSPTTSTTDSDDTQALPIKGVQMKSKLRALLADLAKVRNEHDGAKVLAHSYYLTQFWVLRFTSHFASSRLQVLIFSQFMQTIAWLKAEFKKKGINYRFISGDMPMKKRAQAIEAFQKVSIIHESFEVDCIHNSGHVISTCVIIESNLGAFDTIHVSGNIWILLNWKLKSSS